MQEAITKESIDDGLWSFIEALLPVRPSRDRRHAGRKPIADRAVLNGIIFVLRSGTAWNLLPQELGWGSGSVCWRRLDAWQKAGVWQRHPRSVARRIAPTRSTRSGARRRRQFVNSHRIGGKRTGPNPTERRKLGSKHHFIVEAQGIPLAVILSGANRHDIKQLNALVSAIPPIRGKRGRPLRKPGIVQGDRGYSSNTHRQALRKQGIVPELARIGAPHSSGLGKARWVVERSIAWLHNFRPLKIRYERYDYIHETFLSLACALILLEPA